MCICMNDIVQTITWVNIAGHIEVQTLKNFNCMWTRDLNIFPLSTITCSSKYVHFMTVFPLPPLWLLYEVSTWYTQISWLNALIVCPAHFWHKPHGIITPHLTLREIRSNFFMSIMEICNKFAPSELNHCNNGQTMGTFKYPIKALKDIGCHCPVTSSTIM